MIKCSVMSQELRDQSNEGQQGPDNPSGKDRTRYEGFEGMNYEQRRGPYDPQKIGHRNKDNIKGRNSEQRRDEL